MCRPLRVTGVLFVCWFGFVGLSGCAKKDAAEKAESPQENKTPVSTFSSPLNDTGITWGGNHPRTVSDGCVGEIDLADEWVGEEAFESTTLAHQDCEFGRDAQFPDASDGHAGFSYTKISSTGDALSADAETWACVKDNVSGLMWEVKTPADEIFGNGGLHDADDKYTWYSNDWKNNAGHVGKWGKPYNVCAGYDASNPSTFCNTESFVARVNAAGLCGYSDWRVPTVSELSSILNLGRTEPSAELNYFPHTQQGEYWTATPVAGAKTQARLIDFRFGHVRMSLREEIFRLRLVRSESATAEVDPEVSRSDK